MRAQAHLDVLVSNVARLRELDFEVDVELALLVGAVPVRHALVEDRLELSGLHHLAVVSRHQQLPPVEVLKGELVSAQCVRQRDLLLHEQIVACRREKEST